jgi:catechol 2,3-dioxygenase-like lactoylglutathione lyase family enzyme
MIKNFAHICFIVSNLEKSIHFYADILGFKKGFDFIDDKGKRYGIYLFIGGRNFIELFEGTPKTAVDGASFKHFCLETDNIEETVKELRAKKIEVTDIKLGKDESYQAWIADPDGNKIELHQYTAKSKQLEALR